jgi:hypothetical protein
MFGSTGADRPVNGEDLPQFGLDGALEQLVAPFVAVDRLTLVRVRG